MALLVANGPPPAPASAIAWQNRLSWGIGPSSAKAPPTADAALSDAFRTGSDRELPPAARAQIDAMRISHEPMADLAIEMAGKRRVAKAITDPERQKAALTDYRLEMRGFIAEASRRSLLRDLYAPSQLREQMTWFWFNHFNVRVGKADINVMVGDYENQAIRPHVFGRFRDLLEATLRHPAMLRYLDNDHNQRGRINENYAREIMELHSMGVGSGYTQKDVQELARILTGVGVSLEPGPPRLSPAMRPLYLRAGLFEFDPRHHDFGDKLFLGHHITGSGFAEVEQALDLIAASPATAHHVSERLAQYWMGDTPPPLLIDHMAATFITSRGDIKSVLTTLFRSPEFKASLGTAFKDPMHYAVSAVRLAYGDRVIEDPDPMIRWLTQMGQGLYLHETPDGYPLDSASWSSPGQMITRFEIARQIGSGNAGLFLPSGITPGAAPTPPAIKDGPGTMLPLRPTTRSALSAAASPRDWNTLLLSSPDFMRR